MVLRFGRQDTISCKCGHTDIYKITWLSFALAWGTIRIFVTRGDSLDKQLQPINIPSDVLAQQNVWGFGQVVALGILILPLISFYGVLATERMIPSERLTSCQKHSEKTLQTALTALLNRHQYNWILGVALLAILWHPYWVIFVRNYMQTLGIVSSWSSGIYYRSQLQRIYYTLSLLPMEPAPWCGGHHYNQ